MFDDSSRAAGKTLRHHRRDRAIPKFRDDDERGPGMGGHFHFDKGGPGGGGGFGLAA